MKRILLALSVVASIVALSIITSPPAYPAQSVPSYSTLVTVAEVPDCGAEARGQIDGLYATLNAINDADHPLPDVVDCPEPPPSYEDCMKAAEEAFNDAVQDATGDAAEAVTNAAVEAEFTFALGELAHGLATTEEGKKAACITMQLAGAKGKVTAIIAIQDMLAAIDTATANYKSAGITCCEGGQ